MWMVVYMAKSHAASENIKSALEGEGFLVKVRAVYKSKNDEQNYYEIAVLQSEAYEARALITERGL